MSDLGDKNPVHDKENHGMEIITYGPSFENSPYHSSYLLDTPVQSPVSTPSPLPSFLELYPTDNVPSASSSRRHSIVRSPDTSHRFQMVSSQASDTISAPALVFLVSSSDSTASADQEPDDTVTDEIIKVMNLRVGSQHDKDQARRLIEKMRRLGGLDPILEKEHLDITEARRGLAMLIGVDELDNKIFALDSLLAILKQDKFHKPTADGLVPLTIKIMEQMDKDLMQLQLLDVQIRIAEIYNELAEALNRHYGKRHLNGITSELKIQLVNTASALGNLNCHQDAKLKFYVRSAMEGIRRLKDDRQELFIFVERIYHAAAAAAAFAMTDAQTGFPHLEMIFRDIDPHMNKAWYSATIIMKNLAKEGKTDQNKLTAAQLLIGTKCRSLNWKFTYGSILALFDLCMHGETEKIRMQAFNGITQLGSGFPGLAWFVSSEDLPNYYSFEPIKHFKRPKTVDPNFRLRQLSAECLGRIAQDAPDEPLRRKATLLLHKRAKVENDPYTSEVIHRSIHRVGPDVSFHHAPSN